MMTATSTKYYMVDCGSEQLRVVSWAAAIIIVHHHYDFNILFFISYNLLWCHEYLIQLEKNNDDDDDDDRRTTYQTQNSFHLNLNFCSSCFCLFEWMGWLLLLDKFSRIVPFHHAIIFAPRLHFERKRERESWQQSSSSRKTVHDDTRSNIIDVWQFNYEFFI